MRPVDALGLPPRSADPAQRQRADALRTAKDFEAELVRTFVGAMRATAKLDPDSEGMFGSGPGSDTFTDWFDEKMARELSTNGRIGVAEVIVRDLERWHQIAPASDAAAAPASATEPAAWRSGRDRRPLGVDPQLLRRKPLPTQLPAMPGALDVSV